MARRRSDNQGGAAGAPPFCMEGNDVVAQEQDDYSFYEDALPDWGIHSIWLAEDAEGDVFYQVRPIITVLGVQRSAQTANIQEDSRLKRGARMIKAPTSGGRQEALYLRKREVAIWLVIMDPDKVGERARGRLEEFQADLFHLAERIFFRRKRLAQAMATDAGIPVEMYGEQRGEFFCCGRRHIAVSSEGQLRIYHADEME